MSILTHQTFPFLAFAAFVLSIFAWSLFQRRIRPLFIPRSEIIWIADEMVALHGSQAWQRAFEEEDRARRRCENFEEGKWRRVRVELGLRGGLGA